MNKSDLIEAIAKSADISKAAAGRALEGALAAIRTSLRKGQPVSLVGFGTFHVGRRASRSGRNPRTGAPIKIKAAKVPKFRAGKALRDALNYRASRVLSSVGRASPLQGESRGFETLSTHQQSPVAATAGSRRRRGPQIQGVVVQLVRIPACHAGGRGFESRPLRQSTRANPSGFALFV